MCLRFAIWWIIDVDQMNVNNNDKWERSKKMTWEEVYSSLSIQAKMIIDIAEAYKVDLTELANLQVQKQENDTHINEVRYGRD